MAKQDQIRSQLQTKVFDGYSKVATLYKETTPIYNSRGEKTSDTWSKSSISIVDYDIIAEAKSFMRMGVVKEGDRQAVIPYDVSISTDDYLKIGSEFFRVVNIEKPSLPDVVVQIATLALSDVNLDA